MQPDVQTQGLKIARSGFDVRTCADYELLFNSAWPSLTVAFEQTVSATKVGAAYTFSVTHNLGFVPFPMVWVISNGTIIDRVFPNITSSTASYSYPNAFGVIGATATVKFHIICFNIDITQSANYRYLPPAAAKQPYDDKFGIKIVKDKKNIESKDLRDFILHSRTQSPAVLNVSVSDTSPMIYTMNAGYTTWVYGYATSDGTTWTNAPLFSQSVPDLRINNVNTFTLTFTGVQGSLIALRDPLFASTDIQVTY